MGTTSKFKFRKNDRVGNPDGELDKYLADCFVDTGDCDVLKDCEDPRAIVVGRTGSGKTALLRRLKDECEHAIEIDLHTISVGYISGSTILTFFEELGVQLDMFYRVLWRHVFVVELLKKHYTLQSEADQKKMYDRLTSGVPILRNKSRIEAFEYLNHWGTKFWATTDERIKETKTILEREISGQAGLDLSHIAILQAGGKLHLTEEQTREIKRRGEEVVSQVQMQKLGVVFDGLDKDILTDPKRRYYLVVDDLDRNWADDRLRPWLIRGLIETVRDFNRKVRYAKIVIALRTDLINRVYRVTSDSGFQEEKYAGLNLNVTWTRRQLEDLLDRRVQALVRQRYTKEPVTLRDILPGRMDRRRAGQPAQPAIDYLLDRTLLRPRDAIEFLNACLEQAVEEPYISIQMLYRAEAIYSQQRRTALADEWSEHYPHLVQLTELLKGRPAHFALRDITRDQLDSLCLSVLGNDKCSEPARDCQLLRRYLEQEIGESDLRAVLAQWFYSVGLVGLRLSVGLDVLWASAGGPAAVNSAEVHDDIQMHIHKAFWRVLGVREP